jgi:O-antigen ligase
MSLSQLILLGNWILEGELKTKFRSFIANKPALVLSSVLLMHFVGLLYTEDFNYAINDIRIKLPLLALPLIVSTSRPLPGNIFNLLLKLFVAATFCATIVSSLILAGVIQREVVDVRNVSVFISHIRFALLICISIFVCFYYLRRDQKLWLKIMWVAAVMWFIYFLVLTESLTGLAALLITVGLIAAYQVIRSKSKVLKFSSLALIIASSLAVFFFIKGIEQESKPREVIDASKLASKTKKGNPYGHNLNANQTENGYYVWLYYNFEELEAAWNQRSTISYSDKDMKGNDICFTLMRFLTSKGLHKDEEGVAQLTNEEIASIERGITNVNYQNVSSLKGRIHETLWELNHYRNTGDPNGQSMSQRFEYWKTSLQIIGNNLLIGVGTGDVEQAFYEQYERSNSRLLPELRLRSHNQYLAIAVAFGCLGLLWFLFTLIYPMYKLGKMNDFLYMTFFIVAVISFLNEDTLETQAGVTFFVFFNTIFLFLEREGSAPFIPPAQSKPLLFAKYS